MTLKEEFIKLGYTEEDYEIIKNNHAIINIKDETLIKKLKDNYAFFLKNGYTKEEVIKMTKILPSIYSLSIENIKQKIEDMIALGYTKEEVIKMTKILPSIYSLSIESIKQKIEYYDSINMHELAIVDAKQLMQSVNLSYARYSFYKDRGIDIGMSNYKKLFIEQKRFEKAYGITKKELLEKYDYNKYKEERKMNLLERRSLI